MKLSEKARQARNLYFKNWRKQNPSKVKTYQERYWERKAQQKKARG